LLNAIASKNNLKIDIHVKSAHMDKCNTQLTSRDVLMPQDVTKETKSLVLEIPNPAINAEPVPHHSSQDQTDQSATDQDQPADAHRNTLLMVTNAFHALTEKSLMIQDNNATQPHNALEQDKFSELDKTATDVILAHPTLSQMIEESDVLDQSQSAHALKDTLLMDMTA